MPWTPKQHRLFEAAAHDPSVAARTGIKPSDAARMASEGVKRAKPRRTRRDDVAAAYEAVQARGSK